MDWADFPTEPKAQDKTLESAVLKIGRIALSGHGKGYVYNAGAVRKVLRDIQRETAEECRKLAAGHKASEVSYPQELRSQFTAEELDTMVDLAEHLFNQATEEVAEAITQRFNLEAGNGAGTVEAD